jgi:uncharacterized membrane protein YfcA
VSFVSGHFLLALAIGLVTGLFSGAFGIGGGTVSTPLLRLSLDLSAHVAVGTTMALIIPTSISGTFNYIRQKEIDLKMGFTMVPPAVIGVVLGALATTAVHGTFLMLSFAAFVCIAGLDLTFGVVLKLFERSEKGESSEQKIDAMPKEDDRPVLGHLSKRTIKLLLLGLFAGFMAGFFGVGGGFIFVPCLMYLFRKPIKTAFGTSLLVVAAISIPGTITHSIASHVDFPLMLAMMVGSIPGSFIGSALALRIKDSWLRRGFGIVMLMVAASLAYNELL